MSECRALTNFAGNAVATVLVGTWTKELDKHQAAEVLAGRQPFDESQMDTGHEAVAEDAEAAKEGEAPVSTDKEPARVG